MQSPLHELISKKVAGIISSLPIPIYEYSLSIDDGFEKDENSARAKLNSFIYGELISELPTEGYILLRKDAEEEYFEFNHKRTKICEPDGFGRIYLEEGYSIGLVMEHKRSPRSRIPKGMTQLKEYVLLSILTQNPDEVIGFFVNGTGILNIIYGYRENKDWNIFVTCTYPDRSPDGALIEIYSDIIPDQAIRDAFADYLIKLVRKEYQGSIRNYLRRKFPKYFKNENKVAEIISQQKDSLDKILEII